MKLHFFQLLEPSVEFRDEKQLQTSTQSILSLFPLLNMFMKLILAQIKNSYLSSC